MLALALYVRPTAVTRSTQTPALFRNKLAGRKCSITGPGVTTNKVAKISPHILAEIDKIRPKTKMSFSVEANSPDYKDMPPDTLYTNSVSLSFCTDPYIKQLAVELLCEAALQGNLQAINDLGVQVACRSLPDTHSHNCDRSKGFLFLQEAAEKGHSEALLNLAYLHLTGIGTEQNIDTAMEYYHRADDLGHPAARGMINFIESEILSEDDPKGAVHFKLELNTPPEFMVQPDPYPTEKE